MPTALIDGASGAEWEHWSMRDSVYALAFRRFAPLLCGALLAGAQPAHSQGAAGVPAPVVAAAAAPRADVYAPAQPPYLSFPFPPAPADGNYARSTAEEIFLSTVLDALRSAGVLIDNARSRLPRPNAELAAMRLILLTRDGTAVDAGVTLTVAAWPGEAQAQAFVQQQVRQATPARAHTTPEAVPAVAQNGLFTVQVQTPAGMAPGRAALAHRAILDAMAGYAPRSFETKSRPDDMRAWDLANVEGKNQGPDLLSFMRRFPTSVYAPQAAMALALHERWRGALITTPTEACRASLKRAIGRDIPAGAVIPDDAFTREDELDFGTRGRSLADTPALERSMWDLALGRTGGPNGQPNNTCVVRRRWDSMGSGLKDCECAAKPLS
jgi:hypothetical protein